MPRVTVNKDTSAAARSRSPANRSMPKVTKIRMSKFEIRNKFKIRNPNVRNGAAWSRRPLGFGHLGFGLASDFVLRIP
jgi:hypothetical protein